MSEIEVEKDDSDRLFSNNQKSVFDGCAVCHDFKAWFTFEQAAHAVTEQSMVVKNQKNKFRMEPTGIEALQLERAATYTKGE